MIPSAVGEVALVRWSFGWTGLPRKLVYWPVHFLHLPSDFVPGPVQPFGCPLSIGILLHFISCRIVGRYL